MATVDLDLFFLAAYNGDISLLKKFLDNGIDIHSCNDLALQYAVENNQAKAVVFLLNNGASINAVNDATLRRASLEGDIQTVNNLLKSNSCSQEALLYAMYNAIFARHEDIIKLLLPLAHNEAVLHVVKLCDNEKINNLFKNYL